MSATLVLVWLGTASARMAHEPDLESWATSRMVGLEEPAPSEISEGADHDDAVAEHVEALLEEARTASFSADPGAATAPLDQAEYLLLQHPSLSESSWLMAELWRARASALRTANPELAAEFLARAVALGGPRAPTFGDLESSRHAGAKGQAESVVSSPPEDPTVSLDGPLPTDEVEIDGVEVAHPPTLTRGTHHVRILRLGQIAWAGWVTADGAPVRAPVPPPTPCSVTDLGALRSTADGVNPGAGVLCPHFAVARDRPNGIEVVVCRASACGTWLPWNRNWGKPFEYPVHPPWPLPERRTWILWTVAGVTAIAAGSIALFEAGAFERHGPSRDTFVWVPPAAPAK